MNEDKHALPLDKQDMVNHPSHYTHGNIECIDAIQAATNNLTGIEAFDTGSAIKYLWRWNEKGNPTQDLNKAIFYINHLISIITDDKSVDPRQTNPPTQQQEQPIYGYVPNQTPKYPKPDVNLIFNLYFVNNSSKLDNFLPHLLEDLTTKYGVQNTDNLYTMFYDFLTALKTSYDIKHVPMNIGEAQITLYANKEDTQDNQHNENKSFLSINTSPF